MRKQFELYQDDIKEAIAAYISSKTNVDVTKEDVWINIQEADTGPLSSGRQSVTAIVTAND